MSYDREKVAAVVQPPKGIKLPGFDVVGSRKIFYAISGGLLALELIVSIVFGVSRGFGVSAAFGVSSGFGVSEALTAVAPPSGLFRR